MVLTNSFGKYRLRFRKAGDLRLVSHNDLMHCFERMLRRARLPIRHTQGFHPHPRITFALSLALGVVGCEEVVELDLNEAIPSEEVQARLIAQAPAGLEILSVRAVDARSRPQVRRAWYRAVLPPDQCVEDLPERIRQVLASEACWVERVRPQRRRFDARPYISVVRLIGRAVEMALWISSSGAARPEEVLSLLGLGDPLAAGDLCLERSTLELTDEFPADADLAPALLRQGPGRHETPTLPAALGESSTDNTRQSGNEKHALSRPQTRAASAPTSLISSPMEFDA